MNHRSVSRLKAIRVPQLVCLAGALLAVAQSAMAEQQKGIAESIAARFERAGNVSDFVVLRHSGLAMNGAYADIEVVNAVGTGIPPSGALVSVNVGNNNPINDLGVIYAPNGVLSDAGIQLNPGQTLDLRINFRVVNPIESASRLGLVGHDDLMRLTDGGAKTDIDFQIHSIFGGVQNKPEDDQLNRSVASLAIDLGAIPGSRGKKQLRLIHTSPTQTPGQILTTNDPTRTHRERWCRYEIQLTKLKEPGQFTVSCRYCLLDQRGVLVKSVLDEIENHTFSNPDLYSQQYVSVGFLMVHGFNGSLVTTYDDFEFTVFDAETVALPEPSAGLAPLAFALLVIGQRRRRQLSRD